MQMLLAFRRRHTTGIVADVFEVVLPASVLSGRDDLWHLLTVVYKHVANVGGLRLYCEVPAGPQWSKKVATLTDVLFEFNLAYATDYGLKVRCGGSSAADFPSSADLTAALLCCRKMGVALKATAGLHHPLRHYDSSLKTMMHGFINVFGAGILAHVHHLDSKTTQAILDDELADNFRFTEESFAWRDLAASVDEIAEVRQKALISYGSCSFEEPYQDLQALGLM